MSSETVSGRRLSFTAIAVIAAAVALGLGWLVGKLREPRPGAEATPARAETRRGEVLFQVHCAGCHGADGHGDGPLATALKPPPRDLVTGLHRIEPSPDAVRRAILDGIPGTAMPASRTALAPADIEPLVEHVALLTRLRRTARSVPAVTAALLCRAGFTPAPALAAAPPIDVCNAATARRITQADLTGRLVLVCFWGTTCTHCLKEFPGLEQLGREYGGQGLCVLCICADADDAAEAERHARPHAGTLPVFVDPRQLVPARYDVQALPSFALIDPDGRLLGTAQGAFDATGPEVAGLVRHCLPARVH